MLTPASPPLLYLPSPIAASIRPSKRRTGCSACSPSRRHKPLGSGLAAPGRPGAAEAAPRLCPGLAAMCHPTKPQNHLQAVPAHTKPSLRKEQDLPGGKGRSLTLLCPHAAKWAFPGFPGVPPVSPRCPPGAPLSCGSTAGASHQDREDVTRPASA